MSKDSAVVVKSLIQSLFRDAILYILIIFLMKQTPTGGTAGLCFKKLNITTPTYRIIINRLDRKVNAGLILSGFSSHARQLLIHTSLHTTEFR